MLLKESPVGSAPLAMLQLSGVGAAGVVTVTAKAVLVNAEFTAPFGMASVLILSTSMMLMVIALVTAGTPVASTTDTVKEYEPDVVGTPVMAPVMASMFNPVGSDPAEIDQVYGAVPPNRLIGCE